MNEEYVVLDYENTDALSIRYKTPGTESVDANSALAGSDTSVAVKHKASFQVEPICAESFTLESATVTTRYAKRVKYVYYTDPETKVPITVNIPVGTLPNVTNNYIKRVRTCK